MRREQSDHRRYHRHGALTLHDRRNYRANHDDHEPGSRERR
jgi:hypothetical protein